MVLLALKRVIKMEEKDIGIYFKKIDKFENIKTNASIKNIFKSNELKAYIGKYHDMVIYRFDTVINLLTIVELRELLRNYLGEAEFNKVISFCYNECNKFIHQYAHLSSQLNDKQISEPQYNEKYQILRNMIAKNSKLKEIDDTIMWLYGFLKANSDLKHVTFKTFNLVAWKSGQFEQQEIEEEE